MFFSNSEEVLPNVIQAIDKALTDQAAPYAAFDADGTLWATDSGDIFYEYIIQNKLVPLPKDPWAYYLDKKSKDPKSAYLWLAQIFEGIDIEQVRIWAKEAFKTAAPLPTFYEQKAIIDHLHAQKVQVYIVTASIKWAVEPYAHLYNIPSENVVGVETKLEQGKVTTIQNGPVTYRKGKVDGFFEKTKQQPFFVSGNTFGDLDLLKSSTHIRLAIQSAKKEKKIYSSEQELLKVAKENGWFYLE
jgi:phosphoserine phosphatase